MNAEITKSTTHNMTQTKITCSSTSGDNNDLTQRIADHDKVDLRTFQYTEHNLLDLENDIDPDNIFFLQHQ